MKKLLLIPLLALLFACGSASDPFIPEAESTVGITAPDGFSIGCATNYIRVIPHFCASIIDPGGNETWGVTVTGCNTHTLITVPSSAKRLLVNVRPQIHATGVINQKSVNVALYNDATCITPVAQVYTEAREFAAVVAGTVIYELTFQSISPVFAGVSVVTNTVFTNTGAGTQAIFQIVGYYD